MRGVIRIIDRKLRKRGDCETGFLVVKKPDFQTELMLPKAVFGGAWSLPNAKPRVLVRYLDSIADAVIDVQVRQVAG